MKRFLVGLLLLAAACHGARAQQTYGLRLVQTPAVAAALVAKAAPGNLVSWKLTTTAPGYVLVFDATTAPAAGAVTVVSAGGSLVDCVYVPSAGTAIVGAAGEPPAVFQTGIVIAFSSTGCLTYTPSAVAFIEAKVF